MNACSTQCNMRCTHRLSMTVEKLLGVEAVQLSGAACQQEEASWANPLPSAFQQDADSDHEKHLEPVVEAEVAAASGLPSPSEAAVGS